MAERPNILLITADQQRYDTIGALGFPFARTPNIDSLAFDGTIFTNCYSPVPACLPARASILTGCYSSVHTFDSNYFDNETQIPYYVPTFPELLANAGYDTIAIGKMHFSPTRRHNGFNKMKLMEEIPRFREDDEYAMFLHDNGYGHIGSLHGVRHLLYMRPQQSIIPEHLHGSHWVANETMKALDENNGQRPFMLWASFIAPHPPLDVPHEWAHLYDDIDLPEPVISKTAISKTAAENAAIADGMDEDSIRRAKKLYYCSLSYVDHQVGRIVKKLKDLGLYDNTMIIYTSDHGEMFGDCGTFQKFMPYEASSHIPMIIKFPAGMQAAAEGDALMTLNDLFPTFLDAASCTAPEGVRIDGKSLFDSNADRQSVFIEYDKDSRRWISIRKGMLKYNYYYALGHEELFDLSTDPKETVNLMERDAEGYGEAAAALREELSRMERLYGYRKYIDKDSKLRRLPDYEPFLYHEMNFPIFPSHLAEHERKHMMSALDEIREAIKDEGTESLDKLDLSLLP